MLKAKTGELVARFQDVGVEGIHDVLREERDWGWKQQLTGLFANGTYRLHFTLENTKAEGCGFPCLRSQNKIEKINVMFSSL